MSGRERLRALAPFAVIVLVGILVYANSFWGQFMLDDERSIGDNVEAISSLRSPAKLITSPHYVTRPMVGLSLALSYALGGLRVWAYHLVNLAIHLAAALLLFALARRTLRRPQLRERFAPSATGLALAIALLWLVHPLQTQAVTYIIQRTESLAGLFVLLTVYAVARGADSSRGWPWFVLAVFACLLGMGSKQTAVVSPLLVLFFDRTFVAGSFAAALRRRWPLYSGLASIWLFIFYSLLRAPTTMGAGFGATRITAWEYARTQPQVILHYLRLVFWPYPQCLDDMWPVATRLVDILPGAFVVGILLVGTGWALLRRPALGFLGAAFFIVLAPSSSFVPIEDLAFEHRMYLALAPVLAAVVLGAHAVVKRFRVPRLGVALAIASTLALAARTVHRNRDYASQIVMWGDVVARKPWNFRAHNNYGLGLRVAGKFAPAEAHFREAVRLCPTCWYALYNLGVSVELRGDLAGAIDYYRRTLAIYDYPLARQKLANALNVLGLEARKGGRLPAAEVLFREALRHDPRFWPAHYNLGLVLSAQGSWAAAVASFKETLRLHAASDEARKQAAWAEHAWGRSFLERSDIPSAVAHFQAALGFWPDYPEARASLAAALGQGGPPK